MADYYERLGVDRDATAEAIEDAFRERVREVHPDRDGDQSALVDIKRAREVLTNPALRKDYDRLGHRKFVEREQSVRSPDVDLRSSGGGYRSNDGGDSRRRSRANTTTQQPSAGTDRPTTPEPDSDPPGGGSKPTDNNEGTEQWSPDLSGEVTDATDSGDQPASGRQPTADQQAAATRQEEATGQEASQRSTRSRSTVFEDDSVVDLDEVADVGAVDPDEILDDGPIEQRVTADTAAADETVQEDNTAQTSSEPSAERSATDGQTGDCNASWDANTQPEQPSTPASTGEQNNDTPAPPHADDSAAAGEAASNGTLSGSTATQATGAGSRSTDPGATGSNSVDSPEPAEVSEPTTAPEDGFASGSDGRKGGKQADFQETVADKAMDAAAAEQPSEQSEPSQPEPAESVSADPDSTVSEPATGQATDPETAQADPAAFGSAESADMPQQTDSRTSATAADSFGTGTDATAATATESFEAGDDTVGEPAATTHGHAGSDTDEPVDQHASPTGTAEAVNDADIGAESTDAVDTDPGAFGATEPAETDGGTSASPSVGRRLVAPVLALPALLTASVPTPDIGGAVSSLRATVGSSYRSDAAGQMATYAWIGRGLIAGALWVLLSTIAPGTAIVPTADGTAVGLLALSIGLSVLCYDLALALGANVEPGCHGPVSQEPPVGCIVGLVVLYLGGLTAVSIAVLDAPVLRTGFEGGVTVAAIDNVLRAAPYHAVLAVIGGLTAAITVCALGIVWWHLPWSDRFDSGYRLLPGLWQLPVPLAVLLLTWGVAGGTAELPLFAVTIGLRVAVGVAVLLPFVAVAYLGWRSVREPDTKTW